MQNYPETATTITNPPPRPRPVIAWWQALLFMLAGSIVTVLLLVLWIVFFTGVPANNLPLTPPPASGKADLNAQISQEYVNREISSYLTKNPVSVLGVIQVKQVLVQFNSDQTLTATIRISTLGRQLDFSIKDKVEVRGNRVALYLQEPPKIDGFGLPTNVLNGALDQINNSVANQLNQLVTAAGMAKDCTTGQQYGRTPTLLGLNVQPGVMSAQFSIAIAS